MQTFQEFDVKDLETLATLVHPLTSSERLLLMLRAYCDESYNKRIWSISGYLAPKDIWDRVWREWAVALKDEKLPYFHAADCEARKGDVFDGISVERQRWLQKRFIAIARPLAASGYVSAINLRHLNMVSDRLVKGRGSKRRAWPYFMAFQHQVELMAVSIADLPLSERIAFVFDRTDEFKGLAKQLYDELVQKHEWPWHARLGALAFDDKKVILPLQVADLIAYEAMRNLNDVKFGIKEERWQWKSLNARGAITVRCLERTALDKLLTSQGW